MIQKIIHYCWFGNKTKPKSVINCINSWKKYLPDYEIIEWNENNIDISKNMYCYQAYKAKKWAFVSDYVRLFVIYKYGGIYLDTDVKVIKSWDELLKHDAFIGRQPGGKVNTGSGFGAVKFHPVIKKMLDDYEDIPFIKENGELDLWTCPHRNSQWLIKNGMRLDDTVQIVENMVIYPVEYFSPLDAWTRQTKITPNTYSIHLCDASWNPKEIKDKKRRFVIFTIKKIFDKLIHVPNILLKILIGEEKYKKLKIKIRGR